MPVRVGKKTRELIARETHRRPTPLDHQLYSEDIESQRRILLALASSTIPSDRLVKYLYNVGIGFGPEAFLIENSLLNLVGTAKQCYPGEIHTYVGERVPIDLSFRPLAWQDKVDHPEIYFETQSDLLEYERFIDYLVSFRSFRHREVQGERARAEALGIARQYGAGEGRLLSAEKVRLQRGFRDTYDTYIIMHDRLESLLRASGHGTVSLEIKDVGSIDLDTGRCYFYPPYTPLKDQFGQRRSPEYSQDNAAWLREKVLRDAARLTAFGERLDFLMSAAEVVWAKYGRPKKR
jgi:hypothetical protein